eukprot:scaffold3762_cov118-Isochrysis_galbana.AAC.16
MHRERTGAEGPTSASTPWKKAERKGHFRRALSTEAEEEAQRRHAEDTNAVVVCVCYVESISLLSIHAATKAWRTCDAGGAEQLALEAAAGAHAVDAHAVGESQLLHSSVVAVHHKEMRAVRREAHRPVELTGSTAAPSDAPKRGPARRCALGPKELNAVIAGVRDCQATVGKVDYALRVVQLQLRRPSPKIAQPAGNGGRCPTPRQCVRQVPPGAVHASQLSSDSNKPTVFENDLQHVRGLGHSLGRRRCRHVARRRRSSRE